MSQEIVRQPEPGPEVAAFLAENPLMKELTTRYEGYSYANSLYSLNGEKFTPKMARELVLSMFCTEADHLDLHGVKNWADFYCYIERCWRFHLQYKGLTADEDLYPYAEAKTRDWEAEQRRQRYSRKRKP